MPDKIFVTYTPTGGPKSYHMAIHFQRMDCGGNIIKHEVIEANLERRDMNSSTKAYSVIEEASRNRHGPSRFGRVKASVRDGQTADPIEYPSSDPNAPYEMIA